MAYLDIVSQNAYGKYNRKLAKLVGLQAAVYTSELLEILVKVQTKKTYSPDGFWKLDRKYMEERTTLNSDQQHICEQALQMLGVLDIDKQGLRFRAEVLFKILSDEINIPAETMQAIQHKISVSSEELLPAKTTTPKLTAAEKRMLGLEKCITETDPELHAAYLDWVTVLNDLGKANKIIIQDFIAEVNAKTSDKNEKLRLIRYAAGRGYRQIDFTNSATPSITHLPEQKISNGHDVNFDCPF